MAIVGLKFRRKMAAHLQVLRLVAYKSVKWFICPLVTVNPNNLPLPKHDPDSSGSTEYVRGIRCRRSRIENWGMLTVGAKSPRRMAALLQRRRRGIFKWECLYICQ